MGQNETLLMEDYNRLSKAVAQALDAYEDRENHDTPFHEAMKHLDRVWRGKVERDLGEASP
jgi:hypothetical protein